MTELSLSLAVKAAGLPNQRHGIAIRIVVTCGGKWDVGLGLEKWKRPVFSRLLVHLQALQAARNH